MRTLTSDFQLSASHSAERPARDSGVDLVKSAAILFVILIHVSGGALGATAAGTIPWLESLLWNSAARSAVPLFLLCSGAILLNPARGVTARHIWQRNIPHILLALFFWAAVYQALSFAEDGGLRQEALRAGLLSLLRWDHESHLYFLQIMLLVYAAFPITRTFMDHAPRSAVPRWANCSGADRFRQDLPPGWPRSAFQSAFSVPGCFPSAQARCAVCFWRAFLWVRS